MQWFSFKKVHLTLSAAKGSPFCLSLYVLIAMNLRMIFKYVCLYQQQNCNDIYIYIYIYRLVLVGHFAITHIWINLILATSLYIVYVCYMFKTMIIDFLEMSYMSYTVNIISRQWFGFVISCLADNKFHSIFLLIKSGMNHWKSCQITQKLQQRNLFVPLLVIQKCVTLQVHNSSAFHVNVLVLHFPDTPVAAMTSVASDSCVFPSNSHEHFIESRWIITICSFAY